MNFLAHFFLGKDKEEFIVGNFLGDFVKGKDYEMYTEDIKTGILMHRNIDSYVDHHASFLKSKRMLFPKYRHYAGVVGDIYYDYFLAKNWSKYTDLDMNVFIKQCYQLLDNYQDVMPLSAQVAYKHMRQGDWLNKYTNYKGLEHIFYGMSRYIKHKTEMEYAVEDLKLYEDKINEHFNEFFPDIVNEMFEKYK